MEKRSPLVLSLILLLIPFNISAVDRQDYNNALERYNNKENTEAIVLFERFIDENPESVKTDDAYWYAGRLYLRLGEDEKAILSFRQVLLNEESNRFEESAYDLGKIYYYRKEYSETLKLLSFIDGIDILNSYHIKGLELKSRALYRLAYRKKVEYRDVRALDLFEQSLSGYIKLEGLIDDDKDLSELRYAMAKIYNYLSDLTYSKSAYDEFLEKSLYYAQLSLAFLSDKDKERAEKLISEIEEKGEIRFSGKIVAYGGLDNLSANTFGGDVYTKGTLEFPIAGRNSLKFDGAYHFHSFDFVASNLESLTKPGDTRLVQYSNVIGTDLTLISGTRRHIYNKANLFGDFQFAEDTRDNYISAGLSDSGSIRFNKSWRFLWDSEFEWRTYPNYLIAGRKLDYIKGGIEPQLRLYALDWLNVSLIYGLDIKQYLESKYHIDVTAVLSSEDRLNLYNSAEVLFNFSVGKYYNPKLSYKFNYLKTYNYDYVVTESSGDDFVEGYYDNISHTFSLDNRFRIGERLEINLDGSLSFTNFINYIARDSTDTYLVNNELRNDITIHLDLEISYLILTSPKGTEVEALLSSWWDYKTSNMTYNTTFDTNYSFAGAMIGVSVKMP